MDVITGFQAGALASGGDRLDVTQAGVNGVTALGQAHDDLTDDVSLFLSGAFNTTTGVFTISADDSTGADTMIIDSTAALDAIDDSTSIVILVGVDSADLVTANFI